MGKILDMVILGLFVQKLVGGTRLRGFSLLRRNWYKYGGKKTLAVVLSEKRVKLHSILIFKQDEFSNRTKPFPAEPAQDCAGFYKHANS
jgi:hypothetical protein